MLSFNMISNVGFFVGFHPTNFTFPISIPIPTHLLLNLVEKTYNIRLCFKSDLNIHFAAPHMTLKRIFVRKHFLAKITWQLARGHVHRLEVRSNHRNLLSCESTNIARPVTELVLGHELGHEFRNIFKTSYKINML